MIKKVLKKIGICIICAAVIVVVVLSMIHGVRTMTASVMNGFDVVFMILGIITCISAVCICILIALSYVTDDQ